jgi:conjugative transposon TraK protein
MFNHFRNIETAFSHIKRFSLLWVICCALVACYAVYESYRAAERAQNRIYVLANGKALEATAFNRKAYLEVELRDHVKTFHQYFFSLSPDDQAIKANVSKALYLADESAKKQYDNLQESGYYNSIISANVSQEIEVDSTKLDIDQYPYAFTCYATQKLVRTSSTVTRKLISQGKLRDVKTQTDNNPHGFLIQEWEIIVNQDIASKP